MTKTPRAFRPRRRAARPAFTLVEAVMATLLVALVLAGALHAVGASGANQARAARRVGAGFLAQGLLDEVCSRKYNASVVGGGTKSILVVGGEIVGGVLEEGGVVVKSGADRSGFSSVDDYNGFVDSPPHHPDGTDIPGFTGWSREVKVRTVAMDGWTDSASDIGGKCVTVIVKKGTAVVESRSAVVVNAP